MTSGANNERVSGGTIFLPVPLITNKQRIGDSGTSLSFQTLDMKTHFRSFNKREPRENLMPANRSRPVQSPETAPVGKIEQPRERLAINQLFSCWKSGQSNNLRKVNLVIAGKKKNTRLCYATNVIPEDTLEDKSIWDDGRKTLDEEVLRVYTVEIISRTRLMDNEIKIMQSEVIRFMHELQTQNENFKDTENTSLSDVECDRAAECGSPGRGRQFPCRGLESHKKGKWAVFKTSTIRKRLRY
ncbi:uncharacterized protein LOC129742105 [Uranotaenia lowii]|uniref:uncharacterized protein LOC129742105 n=1 Tax=Uranotaenia lowii TaxID=190385 RepID=UPI00247A71AA|nr:uncharacterized protein LOC129742105 [Uranotaenia lowii]